MTGRPRRCLALVLGLVLAGFSLGGCTAQGEKTGCPSTWDAAVVWSTETGDASQLQFFSGNAVVGAQKIPHLGISPSSTLVRDGQDVLLVANGAGGVGAATGVRFNTGSCALDSTPISEQVVLASAISGSVFYTASWLNGAAHVARHEFGTDSSRAADFPGVVVSALVASGDRLYALGVTSAEPAGVVMVLDAATLATVRTVRVPQAKTGPASAAVVEGRLLFPITAVEKGDNAGHWLGVMDTEAGTVELVDLVATSPYEVVADGSGAFIAHSFINPAHGPLSQYRHLSRYDSRTGEVVGYTMAQGVRHIAVGADRLAALATDDTSDYLLLFERSSMEAGTQVLLELPDGQDYSAGVIVR
jgi:hypothetical protein